ncbi:slr1658 superfamily regulator [Thioflexithrix psekupsensis]|uniref:ATP-binding protein n=1 Tax=Thioflexithrix psekupsensis TaxID=1570016 RepID=A0A251X454_9GAMM|nr:ATP-binding protein [Thioflexithrix psekupsensis]OUD11741.1 ATP-binding protein [Thioflexithrix psekupsensis]
MITLYGDFVEETLGEQAYLAIGFSPSSVPLKQRWRNNGLSADFLADYFSTFFPAADQESDEINQRDELRGTVSYIANELLENAMKFNYERSSYPINIRLYLYPDHLVFLVTNSISPKQAESLQKRIQQLLHEDSESLYLQTLEQNAEQDILECSGLGLLSMINDYGAKLSWKLELLPLEIPLMLLTTRVELAVDGFGAY